MSSWDRAAPAPVLVSCWTRAGVVLESRPCWSRAGVVLEQRWMSGRAEGEAQSTGDASVADVEVGFLAVVFMLDGFMEAFFVLLALFMSVWGLILIC